MSPYEVLLFPSSMFPIKTDVQSHITCDSVNVHFDAADLNCIMMVRSDCVDPLLVEFFSGFLLHPMMFAFVSDWEF